MYQHTNNPDVIVDLNTGTVIPRGHYLWPEDESLIEPLPPPTYADYLAAFMDNFTAWVENVAHGNRYDASVSCASYVTSSVPQFKQDAEAFIAWRDALWTWAAGWQSGFNGELPSTIPTWDEVKVLAPQPEAYGWVVH